MHTKTRQPSPALTVVDHLPTPLMKHPMKKFKIDNAVPQGDQKVSLHLVSVL
jgi:hypothetical protein